MPNIISSRPGNVAVISQNAINLPMRVAMTGYAMGGRMNGIITQASVRRAGRYQFLYTLRDFIYCYIFGEMMGELSVSGVLFAETCDTQGTATGIEVIMAYYEKYRFSRSGLPIVVTIGTTSFLAFVIEMRASVDTPDSQIGSFSIRFLFPPRPETFATFTSTNNNNPVNNKIGQPVPAKPGEPNPNDLIWPNKIPIDILPIEPFKPPGPDPADLLNGIINGPGPLPPLDIGIIDSQNLPDPSSLLN